MKIPDFVYIKHDDLIGGEMILQTEPPFIIARPIKFKNKQHLNDYLLKYNLHGSCARVPGFNILMCYMGTIEGINETIVIGDKVNAADVTALGKMADFFRIDRIYKNLTRFGQYLE